MARVLRNGVRGGVKVAWWTGLGCCTGITVYAAASAVGLAAVLAASAAAFTVIRVAGAAYLVYLGVRALWQSRRSTGPQVVDLAPAPPLTRRAAFRQGLV